MAVHPITVSVFLSGTKWWTDWSNGTDIWFTPSFKKKSWTGIVVSTEVYVFVRDCIYQAHVGLALNINPMPMFIVMKQHVSQCKSVAHWWGFNCFGFLFSLKIMCSLAHSTKKKCRNVSLQATLSGLIIRGRINENQITKFTLCLHPIWNYDYVKSCLQLLPPSVWSRRSVPL